MATEKYSKSDASIQEEEPYYETENGEKSEVKSTDESAPIVSQCQNISLHPHDVSKLIPEYTEGDGVCRWLRRIDHFRSIYGWSERMCLLYGSTRLAGAAENWYRRHEEDISNWYQFKEQLAEAFPETYDEADLHRKLEAVKIEKDESYESYVYRVDAIAQKGDLSTSATLKYLIKGLRNDRVYSCLLSRQYSSVLELLQHVKWVSTNLDMTASVILKPSKINSGTSSAGPEVICFNCREAGHKSLACPKPQRRDRCTLCNRVGHTSDNCRVQTELPRVKQEKYSHSVGAQRTVTNATFDESTRDAQLVVDEESQQEIEIEALDARIKAMALIDTGSYANLIKIKLLPLGLVLGKATQQVVGINGSEVEILGQFSTTVVVPNKTRNKAYQARFLVVTNETMQVDVILGRCFLIENCLKNIYFSYKNANARRTHEWSLLGNVDERCLSDNESPIEFNVGDNPETWKCRGRLQNLVRENYVERVKAEKPLINFKAEIRLKVDKIFSSTPQRLSAFEKRELDKIVRDLLEKRIIRESDSPYSSRVVLTRKRNNTYRMCVNYKPLNKIVERNHFPMPVIEDQVAKLQGKRYFTSLDLKNGFYHVSLTEDSKKYTSFVTDSGQFEFNRLPFGYANSPALFVKFITKVLDPYIRDGRVIVFIDDMLIASNNLDEHFEVLKEVLETLADNHLELQFAKCQFVKTRIEYLGYDVQYNQIKPSDRHIESIRNYPVPSSRKSLQRFLGLVNYFRKFIKGFNVQAAQLYELLKEDKEFVLTPESIQAIECLKSALIAKPVLCIYSPGAETELHTDASSVGFGGILLQRQKFDNQMHPVMYHSRKTTLAESKLHSFELETLAIVYCLQRFRVYLFGQKFTLITDCNSLKQTLERKDVNAKISRWAMYLEQYDFEIVHRPGTRMQHADALSRSNIHTLVEEGDFNIFENALYVAQLSDPAISKIKQSLEIQPTDSYEVRNAILYKVIGAKSLVYVPEQMIQSVINKFHNQMGHFGVDKVCELIKRAYWFPKMREKVQNHVKFCITCISYNPRNKRYDGNLFEVDKPRVPFEVIHVDHLGPLERSKGKNEHILAIVDAFTKFTKLYPTKTTNSKEVMKSLRSYFYGYSTPKVLVSDRGTAFTSNVFEKFVNDHGIKHIKVATACPKANGQVERYNKTIVPLLSKMMEESTKDWDTVLIDVEFMLNNTINRSTGKTASTLLFGVNQRRQINYDLTEYLQDQIDGCSRDLEREREEAMQSMQQQQEYNKKVYDSHCKRNTVYQQGDLVMLRRTNIAGERSKLKPKFRGPYVVKKVLDKNRYVVSDLDNYQVTSTRFEGIFDPLNMRLYQKAECTEDEIDIAYEDVEYLDEANEFV